VLQLLGRQLAQLVVDQRQQLVGGLRVALLDGVQDLGDSAHAPRITLTAGLGKDADRDCESVGQPV
jgi:hypothetical protein